MGVDAQGRERQDRVAADHQIGDSAFMVDAVMHTPNAIGYVSVPLVRDAKVLMISDGRGPAIRPTELSVVTEDYPICRRLLMYDRDTPGTLMNAFIRYVMYKPGQALVEKASFAELTPRVFQVDPLFRRSARLQDDSHQVFKGRLEFSLCECSDRCGNRRQQRIG